MASIRLSMYFSFAIICAKPHASIGTVKPYNESAIGFRGTEIFWREITNFSLTRITIQITRNNGNFKRTS